MRKKIRQLASLLTVIAFVVILTNNCKKEEDPNTVKDIDGNVYHTVTIGTQVWMVENLKVTHYRNGDQIPNVIDGMTWHNLKTGSYCDHYNNPSYSTTYGRLYNWYAVNDSRNIAPTGWHVPIDDEWTILINYLGKDSIAGGKIKEANTTHWKSPNKDANNESGFTALPAGSRLGYGTFDSIGNASYWWSSTDLNLNDAFHRVVYYTSGIIYREYKNNKPFGFSIRCIKDN